MDDLSPSAASFYAEPPVSPTPPFHGSAHAPHHVPEFAGVPARTLSPVVDAPPAEPAPGPATASEPATEPKPPSLERMLLKFGLLTPVQLGDAMREESATGRPLWELVQERGWVSREDLVRLAQRSSEQDQLDAEAQSELEPAVEPPPAPRVVPLPQQAPVAVAQASAPAPLPEPLPIATAPLPTPVVPVPVADPVLPLAEPVAPVAEAAPVVQEAPALELQPVELAPVSPAASAPVADFVQAVAEVPELSPVPAPAPVAQTVSELDAEPGTETAFKVVLRLSNGERIDAHTCNGATAARRHAEELVRGLAAGPNRWPYFSGRFVRPESIISVDVEAAL